MKQLNCYLGRVALFSTAAALAGVLCLVLLAEFIQQSGGASGTYTWTEILRYLMLGIPGFIRESIPYAALIGCLFGIGVLAHNGELTAMQAGGQSATHLAWQVLKPLLALSFVGILLAQWPAPQFQQLADSRRGALLQGEIPTSALWYREGTDYLHFSVPAVGGTVLEDFSSYRVEEGRIIRVRRAKRAQYLEGQWQLEEVTDTLLQEEDIQQFYYPSRPWHSALLPGEPHLLLASTAHQPLTDMLRQVRRLERQGLDSAPHRLALWRIVLQPFTVAGLVLLGFAFLLGQVRTEPVGLRIVLGLAVGLLFKFLQDIAGSVTLVFHFAPLWGALAPPLVCILIGLLLLRRAD